MLLIMTMSSSELTFTGRSTLCVRFPPGCVGWRVGDVGYVAHLIVPSLVVAGVVARDGV